MRWLVTGGAGFIGSHLCEHLVSRGDQVIAVDDLSTGRIENVEKLRGSNFELVRADARQVTSAIMREVDHVVHLAAVVGVQRVLDHPIETMTVNMEVTAAVLLAASRAKCPVLLASTSEVYAQNTPPFRETDDLVLGPSHVQRWGYAVSKLADEHLALAYFLEKHLPVRVVRLFNTSGPRQLGAYGMVLPRFVDAALAGQPLQVYGDGSQTRCFTHVLDVVEALVRLVECPAAVGQVVNVGSAAPTTIRGLASRVCARLRSNSPVSYVPYSVLGPRYADSLHRAPDLRRLTALTGWSPMRDLDQIIDDIAEWRRA